MPGDVPSEPERLVGEPFDRLLTLKEVGLILGLSERSVRRIVRAGDLPAIRIGGSPRDPQCGPESLSGRRPGILSGRGRRRVMI